MLTISAPAVDTVAFCSVSKKTNKFKEADLLLKILTPYLVAYCVDSGTALMLSYAISSSETFANRLLAAILAKYKPPGAVYI